jgi:beta-glucosidase
MTRKINLFCIISILFLSASQVFSQQEIYKDMNAPMHRRIMDLLSRMTAEEKIDLLIANSSGVPRLNIDKYFHGNEALHGIVRPGKFTVFPQAIGLAGMWNPELHYQIASAISDEARGRWNELGLGKNQQATSSDLLTFWSPTINMARDPRWGRTPETYGEDPFLTGILGCAFVKGLQGDHPRYIKTISTPKHFAANNEEHNRASCNAILSERDLREYYLPAFEKCMVEGNAQSIMTAYNAVNGVPCTANSWLIQKILRQDWGFKGYVVSDCSAPAWMISQHQYVKTPEAAATLAIKAGLDMECGDNIYIHGLKNAYQQYMVNDTDIDSAAYRVLRGRMLLGLFDDPAQNPYNAINPSVVGCKKHQELALEAARQSLVLLKNNKNFLPLNPKKLKSVAVVGINAANYEFGDYSGIPFNAPVSILEGIKARLGNDIRVEYAPWISTVEGYELVSKSFFPNGLKGEYFSNKKLEGTPVIRTDENIDYDPVNRPPDPFQPKAPVSIRWTGDLVPTVSGQYTFSLKTDDGCRLFIDDKKLIDSWIERSAQSDNVNITLEAGKKYRLKVEYFDGGGECLARLYWKAPDMDRRARLDLFGEAGKIARNCDVTIAVMGINQSLEREGQDRYSLELPSDQQIFIQEIFKINPKTVVVLVAGSSLAINWIDENIPAILDAWYPGEQGGTAVAEALFGDYNPGGRLPLTFYNSIDELAPFDDYNVKNGRTYQYFTGKPLYEFGYGLSYTTFKYGKMNIVQKEEEIEVSLSLSNTGKREGDEVVQLYVQYPEQSVYMPIKQLKGFQRVHIQKGETKKVTISIPKKELRFWDEKTNSFITPSGEYVIQVGASSQNIVQQKRITLTGKK